MARKRKAAKPRESRSPPETYQFNENETFNNSEDEFYAGHDKVLLDEQPQVKRRRKLAEREKDLQPSDEEVYADLHDNEDGDESQLDDDDVGSQSEQPQDQGGDGQEEYWGSSKEDYYNADAIETEADALEEEAEARRLHQKQVKAMTAADFGFDEAQWITPDNSKTLTNSNVEKLPIFQIPEGATQEELLSILQTRYPEFAPLIEDFVDLHSTYHKLNVLNRDISSTKSTKTPSVVETKSRALGAYLAAVSVYLLLLVSPMKGTIISPVELREHPVMSTILRCRQIWEKVQGLDETPDEIYTSEPRAGTEAEMNGIKQLNAEKANVAKLPKEKLKKTKKKPEDANMHELIDPASKPAKRVKRSRHADLQELLAKANHSKGEDDSDFGDEQPLTVEEAEEKARKKRSLRFYTSQISQKATKRGAASREAGGDDDIPHKERLRDKQDRLAHEAEQNRKKTGVMADVDEDNFNDEVLGRQMNHDANEYYDMLVSNSREKKIAKQLRADAYVEAAKLGGQVREEEQIGPDGKRKITYAIEKNKGLMPKRKKDVRNPRVKKRKKYDEKLKKLSSIRQVYKGGEGRGGYGGELTGIKANVVKSVKL